nr:putative hydro-lyase KRH_21160 [Manis javanica]
MASLCNPDSAAGAGSRVCPGPQPRAARSPRVPGSPGRCAAGAAPRCVGKHHLFPRSPRPRPRSGRRPRPAPPGPPGPRRVPYLVALPRGALDVVGGSRCLIHVRSELEAGAPRCKLPWRAEGGEVGAPLGAASSRGGSSRAPRRGRCSRSPRRRGGRQFRRLAPPARVRPTELRPSRRADSPPDSDLPWGISQPRCAHFAICSSCVEVARAAGAAQSARGAPGPDIW